MHVLFLWLRFIVFLMHRQKAADNIICRFGIFSLPVIGLCSPSVGVPFCCYLHATDSLHCNVLLCYLFYELWPTSHTHKNGQERKKNWLPWLFCMSLLNVSSNVVTSKYRKKNHIPNLILLNFPISYFGISVTKVSIRIHPVLMAVNVHQWNRSVFRIFLNSPP
jgi:hypothetical protein